MELFEHVTDLRPKHWQLIKPRTQVDVFENSLHGDAARSGARAHFLFGFCSNVRKHGLTFMKYTVFVI